MFVARTSDGGARRGRARGTAGRAWAATGARETARAAWLLTALGDGRGQTEPAGVSEARDVAALRVRRPPRSAQVEAKTNGYVTTTMPPPRGCGNFSERITFTAHCSTVSSFIEVSRTLASATPPVGSIVK
jgi:hypothetical protein